MHAAHQSWEENRPLLRRFSYLFQRCLTELGIEITILEGRLWTFDKEDLEAGLAGRERLMRRLSDDDEGNPEEEEENNAPEGQARNNGAEGEERNNGAEGEERNNEAEGNDGEHVSEGGAEDQGGRNDEHRVRKKGLVEEIRLKLEQYCTLATSFILYVYA